MHIDKYISPTGDTIFPFFGFDYWEDYLIVIDVIKNFFYPKEIKYWGITDIRGYFLIDETYYQIDCTDMLGVEISIKREDYIPNKIHIYTELIEKIYTKSYEIKFNRKDTE